MDDELLRRVADFLSDGDVHVPHATVMETDFGYKVKAWDGKDYWVHITTDAILDALEEKHFPDKPVEVHLIRSWEHESDDLIYVCRIYVGSEPGKKHFFIGDDPDERVMAAGRAALEAVEVA